MGEQHAALRGEELAGYRMRPAWTPAIPRVWAAEAWAPERLGPGWAAPPPRRPAGRHAAPPRFDLTSGVAVGLLAVLLVVVGVLGVPVTRMVGNAVRALSAGNDPAPAAVELPFGPPAGNLIGNWSFERGIEGWEAVGPVAVRRELGGHTSSASALLRPVSDSAGPAGVMAQVARSVRPGARYEASAWVRAENRAVVPVALHLFAGNGQEVSQAVVVTRPGGTWLRLRLVHQVATPGPLGVELVVLEPVRQQAIMVDEIAVRPV
jgi:Carbohydrate binding domain